MPFDLHIKSFRRYRYKPLDPASREIRLVVLQTAANRTIERIECSIFHTPLKDAGSYYALSYTWGDPNDTSPIWLNGHRFEVTVNLESALRHIRSCDNPVTLWIDAICIDQANNAERSYQVRLMRDIFSGAHQVIAWIGPQTSDREEQALDLVQELCSRICEDNMQITEGTSAWVSANVSPGFRQSAWEALTELLERPWFSRIWIVQEVVVAADVTLLCGKLSMPWTNIMGAASAANAYMMSIGEAAARNLVTSINPEECSHMHHMADRMFSGWYNVRMISNSILERHGMNPPKTFYNVIRRFNGHGATDPRDKIFALLGLAAESHKEATMLEPDYDMPVEYIYRKVAQFHLKEHNSLDILSDCSGPNHPVGFSSWMPSWRPREPEPNLRYVEIEPDIVFQASGNLEASYTLSEQNNLLALKGLYIDRIEKLGELYQLRPGQMLANEPHTPEAVTRQWAELAGVGGLLDCAPVIDEISLEDKERFLAPYIAGGLKIEAFMRTLLMNPNGETNVSYASPKQGIRLEPKFMNPVLGPNGENDAHLRTRTGLCCGGRRFFLTTNGFMGVAAPEICPGDIICVFLGAKVPFILREEGENFTLVGESYVQGLMAAEAIGDLEQGKRHLQDFALK